MITNTPTTLTVNTMRTSQKIYILQTFLKIELFVTSEKFVDTHLKDVCCKSDSIFHWWPVLDVLIQSNWYPQSTRNNRLSDSESCTSGTQNVCSETGALFHLSQTYQRVKIVEKIKSWIFAGGTWTTTRPWTSQASECVLHKEGGTGTRWN